MYVTPKPLQEECINFICNHFQTLWDPSPGCQENPSESGSIHLPPYSTTYPLHWRDEDVSLPKEVSEVLLRNLSTRGRINDTTITIFDPRSTALRFEIFFEALSNFILHSTNHIPSCYTLFVVRSDIAAEPENGLIYLSVLKGLIKSAGAFLQLQ